MSGLHPSSDEVIGIARRPQPNTDFLPGTTAPMSSQLKPPLIAPPPGIAAISGSTPQYTTPSFLPKVSNKELPISPKPIKFSASDSNITFGEDTADTTAEVHPIIIYLVLVASLAALAFQVWMLLTVQAT